MKTLICYLTLLFSLTLSAQEKGVTPVSSQLIAKNENGITRAVIVGISDYQDPAITDLQYADKDAEMFASFLLLTSNGLIAEDNMKILINNQATTAQFGAALDWLLDESLEGDNAIIYFSGHGDVETKTRSQQGFLLCWDTPAKPYIPGAYPVFFLKEIISTLSIQNKAKVTVIMDACRSGKLAGSDIGGPQLTNANLAIQYANETKILSCQSDEYSVEGIQWGGGHGAFSYHLIEGLYGFADDNNDLIVSLQEVRRYLEDHVTPEVAPLSQSPHVAGKNSERLASVNPEVLQSLREGQVNQLPVFSVTDSKGLEELILAEADSSDRQLYRLFKKSIKKKVFLEPAHDCAEFYYKRLIEEEKLTRLHASMKRNYAAALQDDAQQALNAYLKADSMEMVHRYSSDPKYFEYPKFLAKAAQLLGERHYMYESLTARQLYFEGLTMRMKSTDFGQKDSLYRQALEKQISALALARNAPYILEEIGLLHRYLRNYLEAIEYLEKAMELTPKWTIPLMDASRVFTYNLFDREKGIQYAKRAVEIDSTNLDAYFALANSYHYGGKVDSAEIFYKEIIYRWPNNYKSYRYAAIFYNQIDNIEASKEILLNGIELFPHESNLYLEFGRLYRFGVYEPELAKKYFLKSIDLDSANIDGYWLLSQIYSQQGKLDSALAVAHKALSIRPNYIRLINQIALSYEGSGDFHNAEKYFLKSLKIYPSAFAYFRYGRLRETRFLDTLTAKAYYLKSTKLQPE